MNNACYGKFLQDDRKHRRVTPVVSDKKMRKMLRHPLTTNIKLLRTGNHPLAMVEQQPIRIKLDKPLLVGITILELSKLRMYSFYYLTMKKIFGIDLRLLMTDTDSLIMYIKRRFLEGQYETMEERLVKGGGHVELDMSVYPPDHPAIQLMVSLGVDPNANKGVVGTMKNEHPKDRIVGFVGLKAKMYSFVTEERKETLKAKGVKKHVLKAHEDYASYLACLKADKDFKIQRHKIHGIHSKNQSLWTDTISKQTLSPLDSKRYMLNSIDTLPYGHYLIPVIDAVGATEHLDFAEMKEIIATPQNTIFSELEPRKRPRPDVEEEYLRISCRSTLGNRLPHHVLSL